MRDTYSLADIAAATGNGNNGFGFGGDGAWWIIILFLFVFCGWGNGFGGNGGGSSMQGALTRGDLCMDMNFQELQNAVRNISDGVNLGFSNLNSTICHQEYETATLINGVQTNMMNGNFALQNAINGVSSQIAGCCCDIREAIGGVNTNLQAMNFANAQNTCAITNAINMSTRDIVDNQNANYRALHDEIVANRIEDKNAQIAAQQSEINKLQLAASQSRQNEYLLSQLKECPSPAYIVPNPNTPYNYFVSGYGYNGYNNGCGCGC